MRFLFLFALSCVCGVQTAVMAQSIIEVPASSRAALGIETATALVAQRYEAVRALAVVEAPAGAMVTAQTPFAGVVERTLVIPGQSINAGDALAIIRSPAYPKAQADLMAAKKMRDHRAEIYERAQQLEKIGLRTKEEADEAEHDAFEAALFYKAERERLSLYRAGDTPGTFVVVAPAGGIVMTLPLHSGDILANYAPVATVFAGQTYWARAQVSSTQSAGLRPGVAARLVGSDVAGEIVAVTPVIDPLTRAIEVMVALPAAGAYRLGDVVSLSIESAAPEGAVSVPTRALVRMEGGDGVFMERGDGFASASVDVLMRSGTMSLVRGIPSGARIAVSGVAALKNMASN